MKTQIPKCTGTYADTLEAVGTADLLGELAGKPIRIKDADDHFQVSVEGEISPENWKPPRPGYPFIFVRDKDGVPPAGWQIDYESEREKDKAFRLYLQTSRKGRNQTERALREHGLPEPARPNRELRMATILASMRMGWDSDKRLYRWIVEHPEETLAWVRQRFMADTSIPEHPIALSNSQFFAPSTGKGVHSVKTRAKSPGAIHKDLVNPFSEWMKYRGAYAAMLPYRSGDDFKIYVIEPADIIVDVLRSLRMELMDLNLWGGVRLDIQSSLRLAEQLILNSDVMGQNIGLRRRRPNEVVRGLRQAFFKNLGTAASLMNNAFMPLPSWFAIEDLEAANAFLGIIEEHIGKRDGTQSGCLGSLDESKSGDVPILQAYRTWLTTGDVYDFLHFAARFAVYTTRRLAAREWVKRFSTDGLDQLLTRGYPMKTEEIIANKGFLSVARAIRNGTIYALSLKNRDVRYGLAQEWKQKIKGGAKSFIPVLADFVQQYNWETEHRLKGAGHTVKKEELDELLRLIDEHGAELVGLLLLAYGFSKTSKVDSKGQPAENGALDTASM
ncbi:MAG: hypothetical protein V1736_09785 [Pseudomonadota bacterium]